MNRLIPALLVAATLTASPAHAGFFEDVGRAINRGADALHDVGTLGQHGRDRDAERARAEEEKQRQLAAQAEANRVRMIGEKKERRAAITVALNDLSYFEQSLGSLEQSTSGLVAMAKSELQSRSTLRSSILPALKRLVGMGNVNNDELLIVMQDLAAEALSKPANTGATDADLESNRASYQRTQAAIERLQNVARANGVEVDQLIKQAVTESTKQDAESILAALISTEGNIKALREYAAGRKAQTASALNTVNEELKSLGDVAAN